MFLHSWYALVNVTCTIHYSEVYKFVVQVVVYKFIVQVVNTKFKSCPYFERSDQPKATLDSNRDLELLVSASIFVIDILHDYCKH
jgi:hypothetical protein